MLKAPWWPYMAISQPETVSSWLTATSNGGALIPTAADDGDDQTPSYRRAESDLRRFERPGGMMIAPELNSAAPMLTPAASLSPCHGALPSSHWRLISSATTPRATFSTCFPTCRVRSAFWSVGRAAAGCVGMLTLTSPPVPHAWPHRVSDQNLTLGAQCSRLLSENEVEVSDAP